MQTIAFVGSVVLILVFLLSLPFIARWKAKYQTQKRGLEFQQVFRIDPTYRDAGDKRFIQKAVDFTLLEIAELWFKHRTRVEELDTKYAEVDESQTQTTWPDISFYRNATQGVNEAEETFLRLEAIAKACGYEVKTFDEYAALVGEQSKK